MHVSFRFNPDSIPDLIQAAVDTFDFTMPGEGGQSLGRDLAVTAAKGIADRSDSGLDLNGEPFAANEDKYAKYKEKRYDVDRPGELGGQMFSLTSVLGKPEVSADAIHMSYGWNQAPARTTARNGAPLRESERKATDRQKAVWFAESGREFYGLDETIAEAMLEQAGKRFTRHFDDLGI